MKQTPLADEIKECNAFAPDYAVEIHNNAGGVAYVYLVLTKIAYEDEKALENQVYISPPGKLLYTHSGVGSPSEYAYRMGISGALVNAEKFAGRAEEASEAAEETKLKVETAEADAYKSAEQANKNATDADKSAKSAAESAEAAKSAQEAAESSADEAKESADASAESAINARKSENRASTYADNAQTSETNAMTSATNASRSANTAASSATTASEASVKTKEYRDETKEMLNSFNGIQVWQPNTEYKVGDVVLATWENEDKIETVIAECNESHTSSLSFTNDLIMYAVWDMESINAQGDEYGRSIYETYATKEELNEVADSIRRWSAGMHYEIGDTVLVKYVNVDRMFRCIVEHTSSSKISQQELDTNWQEIFQAARAERDSEGNKISSTYLKQTVASNLFYRKPTPQIPTLLKIY